MAGEGVCFQKIQIRKKKNTYGPRDVNDVPRAFFTFSLRSRRPPFVLDSLPSFLTPFPPSRPPLLALVARPSCSHCPAAPRAGARGSSGGWVRGWQSCSWTVIQHLIKKLLVKIR